MVTPILVPFSGEGSGEAELTWSQQGIWRSIELTGESETMGGVQALPPGRKVEHGVRTLRYVLSRHQGLRTRLRFGADGQPRQVVHSSGECPLEVVDAPDDADPAEVADALLERYERTNFDYVNEWPVRMAMIRHRGELTHAVAVYCHLVIDAHGLEAMMADLATMDPETGEPTVPAAGIGPLELARQQRAPATLRQGEASIQYWGRVLRSIPARRFGGSADRRTPRWWDLRYYSPATLLAVRAIAARENAETSPVLLAAYAVALTRLTGIHPVVTQMAVSNRFRRGYAQVVTPLAQAGICVIDLADISFADAVGRAGQAAMSAYKYAYYDPRRRLALFAAIDAERGAEVDVSCYFNDRRRHGRERVTGHVPTAAEIRVAVGRSTHRWASPLDREPTRLYLSIDDRPDAVEITVVADTHHVSPADMEALVRGIEAVAVDAALDPAAVTGVHPSPVTVP